MKKASFEMAKERFDEETRLFWKRFQLLWAITSAMVIAYINLEETSSNFVKSLVAFLGYIAALTWSLTNWGSKWWIRYWLGSARRRNPEFNGIWSLSKERQRINDFFARASNDTGRISYIRYSVMDLAIGTSIIWTFACATLLIYELLLGVSFDTKIPRMLWPIEALPRLCANTSSAIILTLSVISSAYLLNKYTSLNTPD